jgi:hypothetical protein
MTILAEQARLVVVDPRDTMQELRIEQAVLVSLFVDVTAAPDGSEEL